MLVTPPIVANNFIKRGISEKNVITPLKLQKLVYFLYATYLKATGIKMFNEQFETWTKGPVIPSIYEKFACYGNCEIKTFAKDSKGKICFVDETEIFKKCIDTVWGKYKNSSDEELVILTCQEKTAWFKAKESSSAFLNDSEIIKDGTEIVYVKDAKVLEKHC